MNAATDIPKHRPLKDASLLGLLLSNAFAAVMAVALEWDLFELMAVYWVVISALFPALREPHICPLLEEPYFLLKKEESLSIE